MTDSILESVILDSLEDMVHQAMSVLAGMQLDLFTPLKDGPLSADQIAATVGVEVTKLHPSAIFPSGVSLSSSLGMDHFGRQPMDP